VTEKWRGETDTDDTQNTPALRKLSQEDGEFEVSLCYIVRFCLKKNAGKKKST
jgi:hypothetical protein